MLQQSLFLIYAAISLLLISFEVHAGFITPDSMYPILASVANKGELSDYTFTFIPDTAMPVGTLVQVEFPTQYRSGLGIPINPVCSPSCTISDYTAIFTMPSAITSGTSTSVTIQDVENPDSKGGTGSFKIVTMKGVNVLDQNMRFGTIGMANAVSNLFSPSIELVSGGSSNTGQLTQYVFYFKVSQFIPSGSYIKLTISDTNFGLAVNPTCSAYPVNGQSIQGPFTCTTSGRDILVTGLSADISALQDVALLVQMTNPYVAGVTGTFNIAVLRGGTNVIYDRRNDITGVTITPSPISSVSFTPVDSTIIQAKNKLMDYTVTFKTNNALATGTAIQIDLPSGFQLDSSTSVHYILYGVEDPSEASPVGLNIDTANNVVTITNYKALAANTTISLQLRLQNPDEAGMTEVGTITSYTDATLATAIDQDTTSVYTTIAATDSPVSASITTQSLFTSTVQSYIEFLVTPSSSYSSGVLKVKFPSDYSIGTISSGSCSIMPNGGSYSTATCTSSGNTITITGVTFTQAVTSYFKFNNLITTPATNKTSLIDVTAYQTGGTTVIESWSSPLVVVAPAFTSSSVSSLCVGDGKATVLTFTFVPSVAIPASITQASTNDTKGFLEFAFSGTASDLGTGLTAQSSIPCNINAGLTAISGSTISCVLVPDSVLPVIRVNGFQAFSSGTITISFPQITNPTPAPSGNAYSVMIKSIKFVNRIRTDLNEGTVSVPVLTSSAYTESGTVSSTTYTLSNNQVSSTTDFSFTSGTTSTISGPGTFIIQLPFYDLGWVQSTSLTCQLNGSPVSCTGFPGADWVLIPLTGSFPANAVIKIQSLHVPRYSITLSAGPLLRFISSQQETVNHPRTQPPPAAGVPAFTSTNILISAYSAGAVNVLYTFGLQTPSNIPQGSSIVITFPSAYNLLASNPPVEVTSTNLVDISSSLPVTYTYDFSKVTVTNFQALTAGTTFTIYVEGVKNPTGVTTSTGWVGEIDYQGGVVVSNPNLATFTYTAANPTYYLTFNTVDAFPLNALEDADYTVSFTPVTPIPAYGEIRITFPSMNYKMLPSPPDCEVSGAISTFSSCSLSGSTYIIALDTQYNSGQISVVFHGVTNPVEGDTDLFKVATYYDGQLLDDTETLVTTNRTLTLVSAPNIVNMLKLTFDPKNEGEEATYVFSFLPTSDLTSDMQINFVFPDKYDETLGDSVSCEITSGLEGNILCIVTNRNIAITGFSDYTYDTTNPVTLEIRGVVNPNQLINDDTGQFKVGTLTQGASYYTDFNATAGTLETLAAPGWAVLWSIVPENLLSRTSSDYTFNFTTFSGIPEQDLGGAVQINLPAEFEINDEDMVCESLTSGYASTLSCSIAQNTISITGNTAEYSGNLALIVRAITNPVIAGATSDIQIKIYDSFTSQIIERTYQNLDPFSFSYTMPGPLIMVNNDLPITIERGTQSDEISITTNYPSALNLLFNPITSGFTIYPFYISLSLGQESASFRVTVPESLSLGTYYVEWNVLNELVPAYYTPVRRTQITIVSNKDLLINTPDILPIPLGGNSLPVVFTLPAGPDSDISISIAFNDTYDGITLSANTIQFISGQVEGTFLVYATSTTTVTNGTIIFSLSGTNADIYSLSSTSVNFTRIAQDSTAPTVAVFSVNETDMNSFIFNLDASEICMAYYVVALAGTVTPALSEAAGRGPMKYITTESTYGSIQILNPGTPVAIELDDLVAETSYTIFLYLVDRGNNNVGPQTLSFKTLDRYNAADFTLQFTQDSLNAAEVQVSINTVAFLLSLDTAKVQQRKYAFSRRLLAEEEDYQSEDQDSRQLQLAGSTIIHLQIIAIPNSTYFPSPYELALLLNSKISDLNDKLNNYDTTYTITASNFTRYVPAYSGQPSWDAVGYQWSTFKGALNNYGFIYVVVVPTIDDTGIPSAYQIWRGYTNQNIPTYSGYVEVSTASTQFTINITGLTETTAYNAYIIGGSVHPGYPDLMADSSVVKVNFTTDTPPIVYNVTTPDSANMMAGVSTALIGFIYVILIA